MNCNDAAGCFQVSQQFNRRPVSADTIASRFYQQQWKNRRNNGSQMHQLSL
jgi:hypothetical protein